MVSYRLRKCVQQHLFSFLNLVGFFLWLFLVKGGLGPERAGAATPDSISSVGSSASQQQLYLQQQQQQQHSTSMPHQPPVIHATQPFPGTPPSLPQQQSSGMRLQGSVNSMCLY